MKTEYALSRPVLEAGAPAAVDLLVRFDVDERTPARRPLNLSLVIDRSGSMAGAPLKHAIRAARDLVGRLTPDDTLSIVTYDDHIKTVVAPQLVADPNAVNDALAGVRAGGLTDLSGGWLAGCTHVKAGLRPERLNRVLLLTDGHANAGIREPAVLARRAREWAEEGIVTTTLGFGSSFNEDLLIDMASAAAGNFYFIQSFDDASDVFRIELESLESVAAQNLVVRVRDGAGAVTLLNNYRSDRVGDELVVTMGDVYRTEEKLLGLELRVPALPRGASDLLSLSWGCDELVDGAIRREQGELSVGATAGDRAEAEAALPDPRVSEQIGRLRVAKAKGEAVELADRGEFAAASEKLQYAIDDIKLRFAAESFEAARRCATSPTRPSPAPVPT